MKKNFHTHTNYCNHSNLTVEESIRLHREAGYSTLGISEQTIKNHVSAILRKLNANDRAHAVAMAISNHWITLDENRAYLSVV